MSARAASSVNIYLLMQNTTTVKRIVTEERNWTRLANSEQSAGSPKKIGAKENDQSGKERSSHQYDRFYRIVLRKCSRCTYLNGWDLLGSKAVKFGSTIYAGINK